jgi:small GTP-binding protein
MATNVELVKKICLTGDPAVGKTSLIRRFVLDLFDDTYLTTIGAKVTKRKMVVDFPDRAQKIDLNLMIWDVAGQKEYRQFHEMYLRGMEGVIAVADLTRKGTFSGLDAAIRLADRTGTEVPTIFLLNKCDLADAPYEELKAIRTKASQQGIPVLVTSARTGTNVELAFEKMGRMVAEAWLNGRSRL